MQVLLFYGKSFFILRTTVDQLLFSFICSIPVGYMFAGFTMEWIGRLNTIKLAAIPCCLGWILIATSTNIYMMLGGRILTGLGLAIGTSKLLISLDANCSSPLHIISLKV